MYRLWTEVRAYDKSTAKKGAGAKSSTAAKKDPLDFWTNLGFVPVMKRSGKGQEGPFPNGMERRKTDLGPLGTSKIQQQIKFGQIHLIRKVP